jgi:alcohol dehydrogenase class IV
MGLAAGADVADAVARFSAGLGLPASLSQMGVPRQVLPAIADAALLDHTHATNARPATREDYLAMLEAVY